MSSKKLNPSKDFQSDQMQRSSRKIFTAHYACRNAALNLTPVTGTTNGFIFQIINSLIESWEVRLTWFDCKPKLCYSFKSTSSTQEISFLWLITDSVTICSKQSRRLLQTAACLITDKPQNLHIVRHATQRSMEWSSSTGFPRLREEHGTSEKRESWWQGRSAKGGLWQRARFSWINIKLKLNIPQKVIASDWGRHSEGIIFFQPKQRQPLNHFLLPSVVLEQ